MCTVHNIKHVLDNNLKNNQLIIIPFFFQLTLFDLSKNV